MRTLKFIGIGIVGIVVILLIVGFLLPAKSHVERSITIGAKPEVAFGMVNEFKNWEQWNPWKRIDTAMKVTYREKTSGVGGSYSWASENKYVGHGSLAISQCTPFTFIETKLNFEGQGESTGSFKFDAVGADSTKVTWSMDGDAGMNPIKRLFSYFLMDKMLGGMFADGLHNMDSVIATMPKVVPVTYNVEVVTATSLPCLTIMDSAKFTDNIGAKYSAAYMEIGTYMGKSKLTMAGAPFSINLKYDSLGMVWESAILTDKLGKSSGRIVAKNTYAGEAAMVKYFGSYETEEPAYNAIYKWIGENGKTQNGNPWEVYVTDPGMEKDTAKWETDIYIPIK